MSRTPVVLGISDGFAQAQGVVDGGMDVPACYCVTDPEGLDLAFGIVDEGLFLDRDENGSEVSSRSRRARGGIKSQQIPVRAESHISNYETAHTKGQ